MGEQQRTNEYTESQIKSSPYEFRFSNSFPFQTFVFFLTPSCNISLTAHWPPDAPAVYAATQQYTLPTNSHTPLLYMQQHNIKHCSLHK